ncbi:hypothetical protein DBR11_02140 [Pedobacter sp. HMWF019]|uniref:hypothetical protein n=1 Tax=Pedobacter sp. HMWF019 TaxID=2056856 RepID=UPI000D37B5C1|nr:hypothetical protein [Pedobacter sp. HMWF019]PTT03457.1 hypothetical protein DBR11_02140 [Pedobacter sp. HMWF019]
MIRKFKIILLIIHLVLLKQAYSQPQKLTPVIPLAPEAAEFSKYGTFPVSLVSGRPSISIPIYEVNSGDIKVPINLSYNAGGIQVNQRATWVGLGWSLNSGGTISRNIRGKPDEGNNGYFQTSFTTDEIMNMSEVEEESSLLVQQLADNVVDCHPDIFTYNLPSGTAGRFIYSKKLGKFQSIPTEAIEISRTNADNTYIIKDVDGKKYFFTEKQTVLILLPTLSRNVQSWYLTKIMSEDGRDSVCFSYKTTTQNDVSQEEVVKSSQHSYKWADHNGQWQDQGIAINESTSTISYLVPDEIQFRGGKIKFYSATNRKDYAGDMLDSIVIFGRKEQDYVRREKYLLVHDYFISDASKTYKDYYRLRLNALIKENVNNNLDQQIHRFDYNPVVLPEINSYSQDFWGYYNGAAYNELMPKMLPLAPELFVYKNNNSYVGMGNRLANPDFVKAGILEKITYPTKGYTRFNFEANRYKSDVSSIAESQIAYLENYGIGKKKVNTVTKKITWPNNAYSNEIAFNIVFSAHTNPGAITVAQEVVIRDNTSGLQWLYQHEGDFTKSQTNNFNLIFQGGHEYEITSSVEDVAATFIKITAKAKTLLSNQIVNYGDGVRIAKVSNYDNNDALITEEAYSYFSNAGGADNGMITRNDQSIMNNYYTMKEIDYGGCVTPCMGCGPIRNDYIVYTASPVYATFDISGAKILYNQVTKVNSNAGGIPNGKMVSYFTTEQGYYPNSVYNPNVPGGFEYFDNSLFRATEPVYEAFYKYNLDNQNFSLVKDKKYSYTGIGNGSERLVNVFREKYYPRGGPCGLESALQKIDYNILMGTFKLSAIEETNYDGPIPTIVRTEMSYNPLNLLVSEQRKENSDGKVIKVVNKYSVDFQDTSYGSDLLRNNSMKDVLLERSEYSNTQLISRDATTYGNFNGLIKPSLVQKLSTSTQALENRMKFTNYDYYGNLLNFIHEGGMKVCYLWSYDSQFPIAEIKNADYAAVQQALGGEAVIKTFSDKANPTKAEIDLFLQPLKNNTTFNNSQISIYSHKPLVGLATQTDPKGQNAYYEYDGFQRLMKVKDQHENIIKSTSYNFKP